MSRKHERVVVNVSGEVFETYRQTLERFPHTLLGDFKKCQPYLNINNKEYFFNRCRKCFEAILYYYQSNGTLRCPQEIPVNIFGAECIFYQLPDPVIKQMLLKEGVIPELSLKPMKSDRSVTLKMKIWEFLENPESSVQAKWFAIISFILIWLSIIAACLETLPTLKSNFLFKKNPWAIVELILNAIFFFELLARFSFCPSRSEFIKCGLNWVDAWAVLPYFIAPIFTDSQLNSLSFLRVLKFVRVMRLFRLSRHSKRIKVVGSILSSSFGDLQLLFMCLMQGIILCGSILFFIEHNHPKSSFTSIPQSMWWAVQTVTTLGYGDIVPQTIWGKVLASAVMAFGAIIVSLPVLAIVTRFLLFYKTNIDCNPSST